MIVLLFLFFNLFSYISILQVSLLDKKCGIANSSRHLVKSLIKLGLNVELISFDDFLEENIDLERFNIIEIHFYGWLSEKFCEKLKIAKNNGIKIIFTIHELSKNYEEYFKLADVIIIHKNFLDHLNEFSKKCFIVPLPSPVLDVKESKYLLRKKYSFVKKNIILCSFGFLMEWREADNLLKNLVPILNKNKNIKYQMLHSIHPLHNPKEIEQKIKKIISHNKLKDQVIFITDYLNQNELSERLLLSDLALLWGNKVRGSEFNTFSASSSASLKEFISCRLPIIVNDIDHFSDIDIGSIKTKNNMQEFVKEIEKVIFDKNKLLNLRGEIELEYNQKNYDNVSKIRNDIYEKVLLNV